MFDKLPVTRKVGKVIQDEPVYILDVSEIRFTGTYSPKKNKQYIVFNTDRGEFVFAHKFHHMIQAFETVPNFKTADRGTIVNLAHVVDVDTKSRTLDFGNNTYVSVASTRMEEIRKAWQILIHKLKRIV